MYLQMGAMQVLLVTIQAHKNTDCRGDVVDIPLIVLCNNRPIIDDMIETAAQSRIGLVRTALSQFEVSGRLWQALHVPGSPR